MKKTIILIMSFFLLNHFCFSGIVVQSDIVPFGYNITYEEDCFDSSNPKNLSHNFLHEITSLNASILWELNSKDIETPFHFMPGLEIGFILPGIFSLSCPMICEFSLVKFDKTMIELHLNPNFGVGLGINNEVCFFYNPSIDFTFGRKDRKWFYGGAGLNIGGFLGAEHFKGYGNRIYNETTIGLHLFAGIRFPSF